MEKFTKNDAVAISLGLKKITIDEIKQRHDIPDNAIFCGYLVHIEKADEFLAYIKDTPNTVNRAFSKSPEKAVVFDEFADAFRVARPEKEEIVVGMFDIGKQLLIFPIQ